MSDQAELNRIIVNNLADLEAAAHHVEDVIEPMLEAEVERVVTNFIGQRNCGGACNGLDDFWFAPREWADHEGHDGDFVCHFEIDTVPRSERDSDYFTLSALAGVGLTRLGLFWTSEAARPAALGRIVANEPDVIAKLQAKGFVYDIADKHALYLPILIDREQLLAGLREGLLDDVAEAFAVVFEVALDTAPLFTPLATALRNQPA